MAEQTTWWTRWLDSWSDQERRALADSAKWFNTAWKTQPSGMVLNVLRDGLAALIEARAGLNAATAKIVAAKVPANDPAQKRLADLSREWNDLAAPVLLESEWPKGQKLEKVGFAWVPFAVVGGVTLGLLAAAYLYIQHEEIAANRENTRLLNKDLDYRYAAALKGLNLPGTMIPPGGATGKPPDKSDEDGIGKWIALGIAALAAAVVLPGLIHELRS